jgi:hypothetical protein
VIRFEFQSRGEVNGMSRSKFVFSISATLLGAFLLASGLSVLAQSGRRAPKPTPAATPEVKPTSEKPAEKEKPGLQFIVGMDRYLDLSTIPVGYYDAVTQSCADRLDDGTSAKVNILHDELSRSDAVNRAKAEKEGFVVWLQFKVETLMADPIIVNDLSKIYIEYSVFAAVTAKRVAFGHAYPRRAATGPIVVKPPASVRGSVAYNEIVLKEAAREAAEGILNQLKIAPPGRLPTTITAPAFVPLRHTAHRSHRDTFHQPPAALFSRLELIPRSR